MARLVGQVFGRLTVLAELGPGVHGQRRVECRCSCGQLTIVNLTNLRRGSTTSCGCLNKELARVRGTTHSQSITRTRVYRSWEAMRARCRNPHNIGYKDYGGRGIKVCERWQVFENFYADMGEPGPGQFLERIDNNGDYYLENCRWATMQVQNRNSRKNVILEFNGERRCVAEWAAHLGIKVGTLHARLYAGWSVEKVLTTPAKVCVKRRKKSD